jgi:hypothetical protein
LLTDLPADEKPSSPVKTCDADAINDKLKDLGFKLKDNIQTLTDNTTLPLASNSSAHPNLKDDVEKLADDYTDAKAPLAELKVQCKSAVVSVR